MLPTTPSIPLSLFFYEIKYSHLQKRRVHRAINSLAQSQLAHLPQTQSPDPIHPDLIARPDTYVGI